MKMMYAIPILTLLTSCASHSHFTACEATDDWIVHQLKSDPLVDPYAITIGVPREAFHLPGITIDKTTTKTLAIESPSGHDVEVFVLNGGETCEINIHNKGKGYSYRFDSDGKLIESCLYERGYEKVQNQSAHGTR